MYNVVYTSVRCFFLLIFRIWPDLFLKRKTGHGFYSIDYFDSKNLLILHEAQNTELLCTDNSPLLDAQ